MFSGIIQGMGEIVELHLRSGAAHLHMRYDKPDDSLYAIKGGDSLAINGICLTVRAMWRERISFDISGETLDRTLVRLWRPGKRVNVEPALRLGDPLSGHLVTGHIDGLGRVTAKESCEPYLRLRVAAPPRLMPLIAEKGSIALDGVSLTVNQLESQDFSVTLVPWTLRNTIIEGYEEGTQVHLEVDILARYVARQLAMK